MPPTATNGEMSYRILGSTGERVSAIGVGGSHIGGKDVSERLSIRIDATATNPEWLGEESKRVKRLMPA